MGDTGASQRVASETASGERPTRSAELPTATARTRAQAVRCVPSARVKGTCSPRGLRRPAPPCHPPSGAPPHGPARRRRARHPPPPRRRRSPRRAAPPRSAASSPPTPRTCRALPPAAGRAFSCPGPREGAGGLTAGRGVLSASHHASPSRPRTPAWVNCGADWRHAGPPYPSGVRTARAAGPPRGELALRERPCLVAPRRARAGHALCQLETRAAHREGPTSMGGRRCSAGPGGWPRSRPWEAWA